MAAEPTDEQIKSWYEKDNLSIRAIAARLSRETGSHVTYQRARQILIDLGTDFRVPGAHAPSDASKAWSQGRSSTH